MNHHVYICNIWAQSQYRRLELSGKTMCHVALWIVHTFHFFKHYIYVYIYLYLRIYIYVYIYIYTEI